MPPLRQFRRPEGLPPSPLTRSALAWMAVAGAIALAVIALEPSAPTAPAPVTPPAPAGEDIPTIVIIGKRERTLVHPQPATSGRGPAS